MSDSRIVVGIAAVYLVACLVIGMLPGRRASDSAEGYVAGDRTLGPLVMFFITGATIFSAFAFLGMPGKAYSQGAWAFMVLAYGAFGFIPFYFLGPRAARLGREYGFVTQGQMVAHRFHSLPIPGVMALISAGAFVPYLAIQIKGAGYVLNSMTQGAVSEQVGGAIVYGVVLVYVLKSGVLGVGWTNTFQGIFMMVLAWAMGLYLPYALYGGVGEMFRRIAEERPELLRAPGLGPDGAQGSWGEYTSAVIVTSIGFSAWPHLFMKAFTARSEATIRRTVVLYPIFSIFLVPILLIGFSGVLFEPAPAQADQVLPHMLMSIELSPWIVGLFCAGALAASMSSGDAIVHACSSILVRDGWITALGRKLDTHAERRLIRYLIVVLLGASYGLAFHYEGSLFDLLLYAYGPVVQFMPAVVAALYIRRATGPGVLAGLVVGVSVNILFAVCPDLRPFALHAGLYGFVANVAALALVSAVTRREIDGEERYLAVAAGDDVREPSS
ncbi:MAG: sodium:solute symporter family protein [Planctomycetota bacterium]|nr:MAG: sodium:solute symporter family protein [Planctomycetota bacterium]